MDKGGGNALQVNASHYDFQKYTDLPRWTSYWHQITEVFALSPQTVLIVGVGDDVVGQVIANRGGGKMKVYTFDFDKDLHPDFKGDVAELDAVLGDKIFDVILCCQVLEHLPHEKFENVLRQLERHADHVVLSLPRRSAYFRFELKFPFVRLMKFRMRMDRFFEKFKFDGQHYWEIGTRGCSYRSVLKSLRKFFTVEKRFAAPYNPYHMFFVLKGTPKQVGLG